MDTVFDGKVGVFRCPNCQEFINTSLTECSFCHSPVDAAAAQEAAGLQSKVASACSNANYLKIMARLYPAAYFVGWIPFIGRPASWAWFVFTFAIPIIFIYWWVTYGKLQTTDTDYPPAKSSTWISLAIWGATMVVWFLVFVAQVIYVVSQGTTTE